MQIPGRINVSTMHLNNLNVLPKLMYIHLLFTVHDMRGSNFRLVHFSLSGFRRF